MHPPKMVELSLDERTNYMQSAVAERKYIYLTNISKETTATVFIFYRPNWQYMLYRAQNTGRSDATDPLHLICDYYGCRVYSLAILRFHMYFLLVFCLLQHYPSVRFHFL